jgi:hypothetical protein
MGEWFKRFFHWRYSSVFGVGMLSCGVGAMIGGKYELAVVCYVLGGIWMIGWWLVENPHPKRRRKQSGWTKQQKSMLGTRYFGALAFLVIVGGRVGYTTDAWKRDLLNALQGDLLPSNDPTPPIRCTPKEPAPGSLKLIVGNYVIVATKFPHTVISGNGAPLLVLNRKADGSVGITASIVGRDGKVIAEMKDKFIINQNNYLQMQRSDRSSVRVLDQYDHAVLDARYLNPLAFVIRAFVVYTSTGDRFEISEEASRQQGSYCFDEVDKANPNIGDLDLERNVGR